MKLSSLDLNGYPLASACPCKARCMASPSVSSPRSEGTPGRHVNRLRICGECTTNLRIYDKSTAAFHRRWTPKSSSQWIEELKKADWTYETTGQSLSNNDYKILMRILTQRMNEAVVQFVSRDQCGFVADAFIAETS